MRPGECQLLKTTVSLTEGQGIPGDVKAYSPEITLLAVSIAISGAWVRRDAGSYGQGQQDVQFRSFDKPSVWLARAALD